MKDEKKERHVSMVVRLTCEERERCFLRYVEMMKERQRVSFFWKQVLMLRSNRGRERDLDNFFMVIL